MSGVVDDALFRSPNLAVRKVGGGGHSVCCVVTFDSFTDQRTLDRPGFGEAFFRSRGIDAIHVISRENDWYQYPEMEAAKAGVHAATGAYDRVVTYGSSMGGYAAIRLAGLVGAHCALAMSPQYSIDPTVVQFDRRWQEPSDRFKPVWERRLPFPVLDGAYILYDPDDLDGWHVALLRREFAFTPVPLVQAGHTASGFLQDVGLLQTVVLAVCDGTFDPAATIEEAWQRRDRSLQHFLVQAERAHRPGERLALLTEAVRRSPDDTACLTRLASELRRAGRHAEAAACHERARALDPRHVGQLNLYSAVLERSGDLPGALAVMEDIVQFTNGASFYAGRLEELRKRIRANGRPRIRLASRWQQLRGRLRPIRMRPQSPSSS